MASLIKKLMKEHATATDTFCGCGGSTDGAKDAGLEVTQGLNHWDTACETYQANNPNAAVHRADISLSDPRWYDSTDIFIGSPSCTNHSLSKGVKAMKKQLDLFRSGKIDAAAERSRATMWDVCRFAEVHLYNALIIENVVDVVKWVFWDAWLMAMRNLGYLHECVYINSMHCHPTPQSRDRIYIVFWEKGNKKPDLNFMPKAYCHHCQKDVDAIQVWKDQTKKYGKYKTQYLYRCPVDGCIVEPYYYAAFNCIDWSIKGERIGDRKKKLAPNSEIRIQYGLDKFGKEPYLADMSYLTNPYGHVKPISATLPAQTTHQSQSLIQHPFLVDDKQTTGINYRVRSISETVNTIHTDPRVKLVMPFLTKAENSSNVGNVRHGGDSMQTQTTCDSQGVVVPPFIIELKKTSTARDIASPLACLTTVGYHGLITNDAANAFLAAYNNGSHCVSGINQVAGTLPTKERLSLIQYGEKLNIEDCYYRMLKSHEIKAAMAFREDYIICGNQKDQIKQLGNAVTPPAMKWLVQQVMATFN